MSKSFKIVAATAAAAIATVSFGTVAQAATTASATAQAEILTTLAVASTQNLDFGQIAANGAGVAVVGANGTNSCGATLICTGTRQAAAFGVTGTSGVAVNASVTTTSVNLVHSTTPASTMVLDTFTVAFPSGSTLAAGATSFNVGGSLHVGATQLAGTYNGTFNVSVEYQ